MQATQHGYEFRAKWSEADIALRLKAHTGANSIYEQHTVPSQSYEMFNLKLNVVK